MPLIVRQSGHANNTPQPELHIATIKADGESYLHAAARSIMASWMKAANAHEHATFGPVSWRNGEIIEEYPFCRNGAGSLPIWREFDANNPAALRYPVPTFDELKAAGMYPSAIADIVIEQKGYIAHVIEIVNKHDITPKKLQFYSTLQPVVPDVWRVEAEWIIKQVGVPQNFPEKCLRRIDLALPPPEQTSSLLQTVPQDDLPPGYVRRADGLIYQEIVDNEGYLHYQPIAVHSMEDPFIVREPMGDVLHWFSRRRGDRVEITLPIEEVGTIQGRKTLQKQGFMAGNSAAAWDRLWKFIV